MLFFSNGFVCKNSYSGCKIRLFSWTVSISIPPCYLLFLYQLDSHDFLFFNGLWNFGFFIPSSFRNSLSVIILAGKVASPWVFDKIDKAVCVLLFTALI